MAAKSRTPAQALALVRAIVSKLPDVEERASHGSPGWFTKKKHLAAFANNHHGDGRLALWLAAEPGAQSMLVDTDPATFFIPPYVGTRGWVGVMLGEIDEASLAPLVRAAHATASTKRPRRA